MNFIFCVAGVEVNLLTWRMWDGGLHFSLHNLTATYGLELVHYHKRAAYTCVCHS